MSSYYPSPSLNDTGGFYGFFDYVNVLSEGLFFFSMLVVVWVVSFIATRRGSNARGFFLASFFSAILGMVLSIAQLMAPRYMYLFIITSAIGLVWILLDRG